MNNYRKALAMIKSRQNNSTIQLTKEEIENYPAIIAALEFRIEKEPEVYRSCGEIEYTCPYCDEEFEKETTICPGCGQVITWERFYNEMD